MILSPFTLLVEHLGAEVSQSRPGDQYGGNESKDAEDTHNGYGVTGLDGIDDIGCAVHNLSPMDVSRIVRGLKLTVNNQA